MSIAIEINQWNEVPSDKDVLVISMLKRKYLSLKWNWLSRIWALSKKEDQPAIQVQVSAI